ncbi:MAG TPA: adenylate/guanylate cyclase domain-containing protein [Stellaceae bacterium]|nr:adenylate/guanylate cyclase domain-containing protein [Stellaceae bacterium]
MSAGGETLEAAAGPRPGRKVGLRTALTALVLGTVTLTAALIHASWSYAARENVTDVVGQLNRQIVDSIHHELRGVLDDAWSMQEAVRSIFFQGTIKTTDEGKREFVFLSLLRSQPSLSWISLGFPDGAFFGARKASDTEIDMIEVKRDPESGTWRQRTDYYTPEEGDIHFNSREFNPSTYDSRAQDWYTRAIEEQGPGWNLVSQFPGSNRQAISSSTPLVVDQEFAAVINIVIDLSRLSQFLSTLQVGKTGTVVVLGREEQVVASADPDAIELQENGEMPALDRLGGKNALLRVVGEYLASGDADLATLASTRQAQFRASDGRLYFVTLSPLKFENWAVATVIPAEDFLASIDRNARILLMALAALTLLMAGLAVLAANRTIAAPLLRIVGQLKHIESFELDGITRQPSPLRELDNLSGALLQMARGLASFQKYMPTALVRTLVSRGVEARPGGREEVLTVLFTDIAGFTGLSERLGDGIVPVLGEYLELATASVHGHRGTIDKFIGDAVMAFWGAPVPSERHAVDACAAALDLQRRLAEQRAEAEHEGRTPLSIRIGINTGRMLVGNIGSSERLSYTVIGDPVNVASRLEAVNKRYGTDILIGEDTREAAGGAILVRRVDWVAVYGRMQGLAVYELLGLAGTRAVPAAWVVTYEAGLDAYAARHWEKAAQLFQTAIRMRGHDRPSEIFIERCRRYLASPPPESWTPVAILEAK